MKDRFRFRAWDKEIKAFITDAEFLSFFAIGDINIDDKYVLMQCTGIKDRNGKLIYEYDVVRFGQEDEDIGIIMWNEDECKFVINEELVKSHKHFINRSRIERENSIRFQRFKMC